MLCKIQGKKRYALFHDSYIIIFLVIIEYTLHCSFLFCCCKHKGLLFYILFYNNYKIADKSTLVSSTKINNKTYIEEVHDEKRNLWCEVNLRRIKYRYVVLREQDIKHCGTVPM